MNEKGKGNEKEGVYHEDKQKRKKLNERERERKKEKIGVNG